MVTSTSGLTTGIVHRYLFNNSGTAISNGSFNAAGFLHFPEFSPWGELFVAEGGAQTSGSVLRFLFDNMGNPIANGSVPVAGGGLDVAFSSEQQMFVSSQTRANLGGGIYRFEFDPNHIATQLEYTQIDQVGGLALIPEPRSVLLLLIGAVLFAIVRKF